MKNVIIFGATGNTGVYLVDYLFGNLDHQKYRIIAVGRRETNFFSNKGIQYFSIDISDSKQLDKLPQKDVFAVYMTAAKLPTHNKYNHPMDLININVIGSLNVFEYCKSAKVDRIIYTQTMSNIANIFGKVPVIKPKTPRNFPFKGDHALYVISKNTGEDLLEYYHQEFGIKRFIFHIPTIYQYRENRFWFVDGEKKYRTFHHLIDKAIKGEPIEMWGDSTSYKDMIYVKDYCQMLYRALEVDLDEGYYNVGTGVPVTLKEMIEGIIKVFSPSYKKSIIVHKPNKPNTPSYIIDIKNAEKELHYKPKYDHLSMLYDIKKEMKLQRFKTLRGINS